VSADAEGGQFMHILEGRHPTVEIGLKGDFIANNVHLGASDGAADGMDTVEGNETAAERDKRIMLLSGPNMGGKSTLLRQTCIITIMAQVHFSLHLFRMFTPATNRTRWLMRLG
jgi:DNA mismatch repair protein MSH6